jgi:Xaa-Pro aminopeptidase
VALSGPRRRRLRRLLQALEDRGLAYILVSTPENVEYLTGFPAASHPPRGCHLIASTEGLKLLLVSRLDLEEAEELVDPCIEVVELKSRLDEAVEKALKSEGKLGVELKYLSHEVVESLQRRLKAERLEDASGLVEELREVKGEEEVELIKRAVKATERAIQRGVEALVDGRSEREVAGVMEAEARMMGADGTAFDTIVSCGSSSSQPHRPAGDGRPVRGEPIVIDVGVKVGGYCSDLSRTIVLGEPKPWLEEAIQAVLEAKRRAEEALRPRVRAGWVDSKARSLLRERGLAKCFIHGLGHGVGLSVHEAPALAPKSRDKLKAGSVVTLEPGLYFKGRGGVRIEDLYLLVKGGALKLSGLEELLVL